MNIVMIEYRLYKYLSTVLVSQIIVNMMSEQSRHKIYVCQYQKFWSSYLATLTNNYITVWRVSKKAEGIDVALIKGGCSLLMLSFFNTQCRNVKKILRILGTKKILKLCSKILSKWTFFYSKSSNFLELLWLCQLNKSKSWTQMHQ